MVHQFTPFVLAEQFVGLTEKVGVSATVCISMQCSPMGYSQQSLKLEIVCRS